MHHAKLTNHGLFKNDLLKIRDDMEVQKQQWATEAQLAEVAEKVQHAQDIASVRRRESLVADSLAAIEINQAAMDEVNARRNTPLFRRRMGAGYTGEGEGETEGLEPTRPSASAPTGSGPLQITLPRVDSDKKLNRVVNKRSNKGGNELMTSRGGEVEARPSTSIDATTRSGAMNARAAFLKESSSMVLRMRGVISGQGETNQRVRLNRLMKEVCNFRKEYDVLKNKADSRSRGLETIQHMVRAQQKSSTSINNIKQGYQERLQALAMKLNTVTIKITETEENRKNYALNISHLKEEEVERFYQLESLRRKLTSEEQAYRKMNDLKLQSLEEKNRAEQELSSFANEISGFDTFISDQMGKFHSISVVTRQRNASRRNAKEAQQKKVQAQIAGRMSKLDQEMTNKSGEAATLAEQLESVNERLRYFEKRFQQIVSATGLTNPDAIINKFALKEEIKKELNSEISTKQKKIQDLTLEQAALSKIEQDFKQNFFVNKWRHVDGLQEGYRKEHALTEKNARNYDSVNQKLACFQEGLVSLVYHVRNVQSEDGTQVDLQSDAAGEPDPELNTQALAGMAASCFSFSF